MRKLIVTVIALGLALVPAALAATGSDEPSTRGRELITSRLLDHPALPRHERRKASRHHRKAARKAGAPAVSVPPQLQAIAQCESGGDPQAIGGGGQYRGKYQFSYSTWAAVGGSGDPAAAPEAEQDRRAAMLYARSGGGQWPVCGG